MKLITLTILCYIAAATSFGTAILTKYKIHRYWSIVISIPALLLHGYLLYKTIDLSSGQNLCTSNILALCCWLITICTIAGNINKPFEILSAIALPVTIIAVIIAAASPGEAIMQLNDNAIGLAHILTAITAFSIIGLAAANAMLINLQSHLLKNAMSPTWANYIPPLETMEYWLFSILRMSFILLTVSLICGLAYLDNNLYNKHIIKLICSIITWIILASLLVGRNIKGFRGKIATRGTLTTLGLLVISIFASKIWIS